MCMTQKHHTLFSNPTMITKPPKDHFLGELEQNDHEG
jgi:hypothetical protein